MRLRETETDCGIVASTNFAPDVRGGPTGTVATESGTVIAVTRHADGITCERCRRAQ
jgi:hypothetical protein